MKQALTTGTLFQVVVGVPGPDMETGIVIECLEPGKHRVLRMNIFDGSISEDVTTATLYPTIPYPGQFRQEDADKLRAALSDDKETP